MRFKKFAVLALVLLALPACRRAKIYNPEPFKALSATSKTQKVIRAALAGRGWRIVKEEPGEIHAAYVRRSLVARIVITYADTVTIKYEGSENLKHGIDKYGDEVIHSRYNKWIETLVSDINRNMLLASD